MGAWSVGSRSVTRAVAHASSASRPDLRHRPKTKSARCQKDTRDARLFSICLTWLQYAANDHELRLSVGTLGHSAGPRKWAGRSFTSPALRWAPLAPPPLVTGELLPLDRLEQPAGLVGAQLLHRFALGGPVAAARHRADRGVGRCPRSRARCCRPGRSRRSVRAPRSRRWSGRHPAGGARSPGSTGLRRRSERAEAPPRTPTPRRAAAGASPGRSSARAHQRVTQVVQALLPQLRRPARLRGTAATASS